MTTADKCRKQFDPDTRDSIRIHVVHGSWKAEDRNGIGIIVCSVRTDFYQ